MPLKKQLSDLRLSFEPLSLERKFEQVCLLMLPSAFLALDIQSQFAFDGRVFRSLPRSPDPLSAAPLIA